MPGIALKPGFSEESLKDDEEEPDGAAGTSSAHAEEDTFDASSWGMPSNLPPARSASKLRDDSSGGSGAGSSSQQKRAPPPGDGRTWHYVDSSKQQRTAKAAELRKLYDEGAITGSTLVWAKGEAGWAKLEKVAALQSTLTETPVAAPAAAPLPPMAAAPPTVVSGLELITKRQSLAIKRFSVVLKTIQVREASAHALPL